MILKTLYATWAGLIFLIGLLLHLPFFYLFSINRKWHKHASMLNKTWAKLFFFFIFVPVKIEYRFRPKSKQQYIYCANHSTLIDIVTLGIIAKGHTIFMGKKSLAKFPVFGYIFSKFNIMVDRKSKIGSYRALIEAKNAIDEGKNIVFFPEASRSKKAPKMRPFKDGAFRLAIEKGIPIIPVSILYNWKLAEDRFNHFRMTWCPLKAIVHEPIFSENLNLEDVDNLKDETYQVIEQGLIDNDLIRKDRINA